jgi:hypothetical protein
MDLEAAGAGQSFHLGIGRAHELDQESGLSETEAQMERGGDRAGPATLVEHLHDAEGHSHVAVGEAGGYIAPACTSLSTLIACSPYEGTEAPSEWSSGSRGV